LPPAVRLALSFNPKWKIKQQQNATRDGAIVSCVLLLPLPFPFGQLLLHFQSANHPATPFLLIVFFFFGPFWKEIEWFLGCSSTYNQNNMSTCTMVKTHQHKNIKKNKYTLQNTFKY